MGTRLQFALQTGEKEGQGEEEGEEGEEGEKKRKREEKRREEELACCGVCPLPETSVPVGE